MAQEQTKRGGGGGEDDGVSGSDAGGQERREKLAADGAIPVGNTPEEFGALIKSEIPRWGEVIKRTGARAN